MEQKINEIEINGIKYIPKDSVANNILAEQLDNMDYCMIRGEKSGVFMGYVKHREGKEVELLNSRRIWYWEGAASLSQLSQEGTSKPDKCKFPTYIKRQIITDVIEIDFITEKAKKILNSVPIWNQ